MPNIVLHNAIINQDTLAKDFNPSRQSVPSTDGTENGQPGKIYLLYGDKRIFQLSLLLASHSLANGKPIAVVDGCCRFNVHTISHFARQRRIKPELLLQKIFISRGFTSYQMESAINDRLVPFLKRIRSNTALIFGLLDTFYDEQVPLRDARNMLNRIITHLDKMRRQGFSILLTSEDWNVLPKERNQFLSTLKNTADVVYKLAPVTEGTPACRNALRHASTISKNIEPDDEIKLIKERSIEYGPHTANIHANNRQRN